jgi:hypothetical protein
MVQEEQLTNLFFSHLLKKVALCVYGEYAKWQKSNKILPILVYNRTT